MESSDRATTARSDTLRTLFDISPDAVVLHDAEGAILDANSQASEDFGYTRKELLSLVVSDIEISRDPQELETLWGDMDVGERTLVEGQHRRADGSTYPAEVTLRKIDMNGGERFLTISRDISERQEAEEELAAREQKYRNLFEESRDPLMLLDEDGFRDCNEACLDLFNIDDVETFTDYSPWELSPAEQPDGTSSKAMARDHIESAFETGGDFFEWTHRTIDGEDFEATVKLSRFEHESESLLHAIVRDISERKKRQRELERHKTFLDHSTAILTVLNESGDFEYQSPAIERVLGYEPEAILGDNAFEYIHPEDTDHAREALTTALKQPEEEAVAEFRFRCDDGEWRWLRSIAVNYHHPAIEGVIVNSVDITDRKEHQEELRKLTDRLELAVEGANLGVWHVDFETGEIEINDQWAETLGYTPAELSPDLALFQELIHPDDRESIERMLAEYAEGERNSHDTEHRKRTASGDWKWVRDIGRVADRDEDGNPTRAVGIQLDIDDRKRTERELSRERDFFDAVIESLPYSFYVLNVEDYTVEYANDKANIGKGETCYEITHRRNQPCDAGEDPIACPITEVTETAEPAIVEHVHYDEEGKERIFEVHASPIFGENDEVVQLAESNIDVTERAEHEQRLAALHDATRLLIDAESVEEVAEIAVNSARDLLDFSLPAMWVPRDNGQQFELLANTEAHQRMLEEAGIETPTFPKDHWTWEAFDTGETIVRSPIPQEDLAVDVPLQSTIIVPLGHHGFISFSTRGEVEFSDREITLAETLAKNAQIVLDELSRQEEVKRQQQFTSDLLDAINDVVYVLDTDGDFLDWNQAFEEVTGYGGDELASMNATDLFAEEDHEAVGAAVEESFETGRTRVELDFLTANGESIPYEFVANSFENPAGDPVLAGIGRDRSQHVEYERRLESQRNNLEILNQVVRHDIRNDMTVVRGRARLLEDHIDDEGGEHLEAVLRGAESTMDLTTTARDLAETMLSSEADLEPVQLKDHIEAAIEHTRSQFADAVVTAERMPEAEVLGNELLEAVFRNLLTNGVIHNDKEVPEVHISSVVENGKVIVSVTDNGPGIPDVQKEEIFGKGEKGLDSPGTGIGLYLVQTLVDQYGGEVWVEDNDPEGSVFSVKLPQIEPEGTQ